MNKVATHAVAAFIGAITVVVALIGLGQPAPIAKWIADNQPTASDELFDQLDSFGFHGGVYYPGQDYVVVTVTDGVKNGKVCGFNARQAGDKSWDIFTIDDRDYVSMEKPTPALIRSSKLWAECQHT